MQSALLTALFIHCNASLFGRQRLDLTCVSVLRAFASRSTGLKALMVLALSLTSSLSQALTYHPRMDHATWISDASVLQCRLIQPIPSFGRAVFDHSAGQPLRFYLQTVSNPLTEGLASLKSNPPSWNPQLPVIDLGRVNVKRGDFPVQLEATLSTRLLAELFQGKSPSFVRRAWYIEPTYSPEADVNVNAHGEGDTAKTGQMTFANNQSAQQADDNQAIEVALSSVNFREAYSLYRQCLARLMPVGFDQLERSRVKFDSDKWELKPETIEWLDLIAHYATADSQLDQMYIDGHTDNTHTTTYNVELSRKRAEAVAGYLVSKGVSANQITTRFHGERYPVEPNTSAAGKQANRRVTIRLERIVNRISQR